MPKTVANPLGSTNAAENILAIDIGAGTQDILVYDREQTPENSFRLVMPSQTQIVGQQIRRVTAAGRPLHLIGQVMGGGASTAAIKAHLDGCTTCLGAFDFEVELRQVIVCRVQDRVPDELRLRIARLMETEQD